MFREYWYLSGINNSMSKELENITDAIETLNILNEDDLVIDIGSNDSTLLKHYKNPKTIKVGFEPAHNLNKLFSEKIFKIIPEYFSFKEWKKYFKDKKAKVITAIGMFYDLDEPHLFLKDVYNCLDDKGLFVIQMMYLPFFIKRNAFDGICHEHLEYYSILSLEYLLKQNNFKIIGMDIRENVNEGSARFFITKQNNNKIILDKKLTQNLQIFRKKEIDDNLGNIDVYITFFNKINKIKKNVTDFLKKEVKNGKIIHGYAASTKGNTILQFFEIDENILTAISDRNPEKWGKLTSGSNIPIISEKESRTKSPDYYFVLAWHFIENFLERK